jgi:hypothetical protein
MARLINTETQVVVNVDDSKVERMGPLYKPAPADQPAKADSAKTSVKK